MVSAALDEVLWIAMKVHDEGSETTWEIEGEEGLRLDQQRIADLVQQRKNELTANPLGRFEWRRRRPSRSRKGHGNEGV